MDSNTARFLLYWIDHAVPKNISRSWEVPFARIIRAVSVISNGSGWKTTGHSVQYSQTFLAMSHLRMVWEMDPASLPQLGHVSQQFTLLLCRFSIVGNAFIHALQAKIRIFADMFRCHIRFHNGILQSSEELSPSSEESTTLRAV